MSVNQLSAMGSLVCKPASSGFQGFLRAQCHYEGTYFELGLDIVIS